MRTKAPVMAQKFTVDPTLVQGSIVDSGNVETDSDEDISPDEKKQRDRTLLKERLAREYDESVKQAKEAADAGEGCTMCSS